MSDGGGPARSTSSMGRWALVGGFIVAFLGGLAAATGHLKTIWTNVQELLGGEVAVTSEESSRSRVAVKDVYLQLRVNDLTAESPPISTILIEATIEKEGPVVKGCKPQLESNGRHFGTVQTRDTRESLDLIAGPLQRLVYLVFQLSDNIRPDASVRLVCDNVVSEWTVVNPPR